MLRVRIAFLAIVFFAVLIVGKLIDVQFVNNEQWIEKANQTNVRLREIKATRGNIYSDNGSLMATSLPFYTLAFDPSISLRDEKRKKIFEEGIDSLCIELASFFGDKSAKAYYRLINNARGKGRQYLKISKRLINYHEKKVMSEWPLFRQGQMYGGVIFEKIDKRFIPFGHLAGRTIGYRKIEKDKAGKNRLRGAGLEYSFDDVLGGKSGKALFAKMSGGGWKPLHSEEEVKPVHGNDIESTLDINLQDVVEETLHEALKEHDADYGCVVVMEVRTGEIKAIANLSQVKSGRLKGAFVENYNHAVGTNVEPGSTIKLASMLALFEDANLELDDSIFVGKGKYDFYERTMYDSHADKPVLTVQEVFERSSNVGVARLAVEHFGQSREDQQRFIDYFGDFGLKYPLGFQIAGEATPHLKNPDDKSWSGTTLPWISHGYELAVSPLHILTLYNGVANNGKLIQPILVKRLRQANKVIREFEPVVMNKQMCSPETLAKVQTMLEGVVERGTARNIKTGNYKIAGKTGTAKKLKDGKYTKEYMASFCGYFPADDPKYSCIVMVDHPKNGKYYGNQVAAPVFRTIADKVFARDLELHAMPEYLGSEKGVFPVVKSGNYEDLSLLCSEMGLSNWGDEALVGKFVKAKRNDELKAIQWNELANSDHVVPNVKGMRLRDAMYLLENLGLKVEVKGQGRVVLQSITPGRKVLVGSKIKIELS